MPDRPLMRGGRGGFKGEVRGLVPNKPLTHLSLQGHARAQLLTIVGQYLPTWSLLLFDDSVECSPASGVSTGATNQEREPTF